MAAYILAGDIGGTKTVLSLYEEGSGPNIPLDKVRMHSENLMRSSLKVSMQNDRQYSKHNKVFDSRSNQLNLINRWKLIATDG